MEQKIYEMLVKMQSSMVEMQSSMEEMNERLKRVEGTVNRIEASQTEDVVGMLKVTKKKTDFEIDYLNNKITEIDKRLFSLGKRIEN